VVPVATSLENTNQFRWTTSSGTCLVFAFTDMMIGPEAEIPDASMRWSTFTN